MQRRKFIEDAAQLLMPAMIAQDVQSAARDSVRHAKRLWDELEAETGRSVGVAAAPSNSSWDVIDAKLKSVERELTICMRLLHEHGKLLHKVTSASSGER